ncbi:helix-turn-helix domain-containing protein [Streptomyces violascens]|uniref:helix-turn-helix domain-containing protein n=1 Tax=Streptomyces violascens TaxID=67381 RepID=UPI0036788E6A
MQAAELFAQQVKPPEVARQLRVNAKSAYQWQQLWRRDGAEALVSRRPSGGRCRLSPYCLKKLAGYLAQGPAAHGWTQDQVWTAARVASLIGRKFHVSYSVSGATRLMRYERLVQHSETLITWAAVTLMTRRLTRTSPRTPWTRKTMATGRAARMKTQSHAAPAPFPPSRVPSHTPARPLDQYGIPSAEVLSGLQPTSKATRALKDQIRWQPEEQELALRARTAHC